MEFLSVDIDFSADNLDGFARQRDDPLDVIFILFITIRKDNDIKAFRISESV